MFNLEKELIEMVRYFDSCKIPEEKQRQIITNGVDIIFDGGWGERITLDCFQFLRFVKMCKSFNADFDVNKFFRDLKDCRDDLYIHILRHFLQTEEEEKQKTK